MARGGGVFDRSRVDNCRDPLSYSLSSYCVSFPVFILLSLLSLIIMSTWFDNIQKSFTDVPIDAANDKAISTTEFLEAAEALTTLFGTFAAQLTENNSS